MSDTDEGGELSPEAKAFLAHHEKTGEPTAEGLERVRQRLAAPPARTPVPVSKRRPLVAPEVWAAAAVVVLLLGAQGLYLAFRTPAAETKQGPTPADESDTKAVIEAWRAGDYEGANRLASKECRSTSCRKLAPAVAKALGFTRRLDELTEAERNELASLDRGIDDQGARMLRGERDAGKDLSVLADTSAEALFKEGVALKKAKNFDAALDRLEQCIKIDPRYHVCYRMLGSVYASIAMRDQTARDMEKARKAYETFLEVAPADDEYVPKVRAILEAASDAPQTQAPELIVIPGTVKIALGGKKTLPMPGLSRVAVGDPTIADVKVLSGTDLEVTGENEGKTTLLVWLANGERKSFLIEVKALQPDAPNPDAEDSL